jgi:RNA-directed DNA polymerase
MMNGTKKSDSSIVPAKPANKAERSTAELVEGDDGTKRNAELQSTVRTQSREAVTQAQARIRGAVTRNEKEKATSRTPSMYVDEKSDEAIVLAKRLNKGRQLPAEVVEGRASPKGNSR